MKVSIVIPLFNRVDLTRDCVRALRRHTPDDLYELILVDNASSDGTTRFCATLENVKVLRNEENLGFSIACNQGAAEAIGDVVVFLNNDTEVHPGWLQAILEAFDDDQVGITGSKLLFPDGRVQHAGVIMLGMTEYPRLSAMHYPYKCPSEDPMSCSGRDVQVVTGACLAIRASILRDLGAFDEEFWCGYEDVDLCLRVGAAGHRVRYVADSVVTHRESASGAERFRSTSENEKLLNDRWADSCVVDMTFDGDDGLVVNPDGALSDHRAEVEASLVRVS
jgi:GT2 family glycosyltransferase